jgi:iron complex transport system substrate-binding protein
MRKRGILSLFILGAIILSLFCGCSDNGTEDNSAEINGEDKTELSNGDADEGGDAVSVIDAEGREVTVPASPQKIVSTLASDVEILYAIGAGDQIVGVGEYCDYPAEVSEKEVVASGAETNLEQILALAPDVVIMGSMAQDMEQVEQLEAAGVPTVVTKASNIAETYETIELLGTVTGHGEEASKLVEDMKAGFEEIRESAGQGGKTIYFEVSPLEYGLWTAGSNTFMQELCEIINVENIFADVDGWAEISEEEVLSRNPDYIATVTMYFGEGPTPDEEILSRENWQGIAAIKNGNVICADNSMMTRPGPRLVEAARVLADFVYGSESK